jgi:hypothetical protein
VGQAAEGVGREGRTSKTPSVGRRTYLDRACWSRRKVQAARLRPP